MLKLFTKKQIFVFIAVFIAGFAVGYLTMCNKAYNAEGNKQTFLQILNPF